MVHGISCVNEFSYLWAFPDSGQMLFGYNFRILTQITTNPYGNVVVLEEGLDFLYMD
jgi:hypothetical protein